MNEIALVLHGCIGFAEHSSGSAGADGKGKPANVADCANSHKYSFSNYNYDTFFHIWNPEHEKELNDLYNPISSLSEPIIYDGKEWEKYLDSRFLSLNKAMNLKREHEIKNNFRYDWVIISRFDNVILTKLNLDDCDNDLLWGCGIMSGVPYQSDFIWICNSEKADKIGNMINERNEGQYQLNDCHAVINAKIKDVFGENINNFVFKQFEDLDLYRFVINPSASRKPNEFATTMKDRLEEILKK